MASVSKTTFEFDVSQAERSLKSLISTTIQFENLTNNLGKNVSLGSSSNLKKQVDDLTKSVAQAEKEKVAFAKNAQADITRIEKENALARLEIEKQLTKQINAEQKLRVNEAKRANLEAIGELKAEEAAKRQVLNETAKFSNSSQDAVNRFNRQSPKGSGLNLSSFQKQNLSYQANDVITGLASGQSPLQILAQQGGQIAQIFDVAQAKAFVAAFAPLVAIAAAGVAAIALTYKITGDIRTEAERRLKVEEKINSAINNQILSQQKGLADLAKARQQGAFDRVFDRSLQGETVDGLTETRRRLEERLKFTRNTLPVIENGKVIEKENEEFQRLSAQILKLDVEIENARNKQSSFNKGTIFEDTLRIEQQARDAQAASAKKALAAQAKFNESVEKGKEKVKDLGKTYNDVFNNLSVKSNADNPFSKLFSDADKQMKTLRENTKGLSSDLQEMAVNFERQINQTNLFGLRLDTNLKAFDLRSDADRFRDARPSTGLLETQIGFALNSNNLSRQTEEANYYATTFNPNNPKSFAEFNRRNFNQGFSETDLQIQNALKDIAKLNSLSSGGTGLGGQNAIAEKVLNLIPPREELLKRINQPFGQSSDAQFLLDSQAEALKVRKRFEEQNFSDAVKSKFDFEQRLEKQFDIVRNLGATSESERSLANRKIIELTSGLNPNELTSSQREQAINAREREAERLLNAEKDAARQREEQLQIQKRIDENLKKLADIAEKEGLKGIENIVRIVDETGGKVRVGKVPTQSDTAKRMVN